MNDLAISDSVGSLSHVRINVGKNIDASILVDIVDAVLLGETLARHVIESVYNELEGTVGEGGIGSLDVLVVWHVLIEDSLVGKLVDFGRVSNLGLIFEGLFVLDIWTDVQEVADNSCITHPSVDGSLHELSLILAHLARWIASIAPISITILLSVAVVIVVVSRVAGLVASLVIARV